MKSIKMRLSVYQKPQIIIPGLMAVIILYLIYRNNNPLFHSMNEILGIVITSLVCIISIKTFKYSRNNLLLFFGYSFIIITILKFINLTNFHSASATFGTDIQSFFAILIEYLYLIMLAVAPFFIQNEPPRKTLLGVYLVITGVFAQIIIWPNSFIAGAIIYLNFTLFKNISGYIIIFIAGLALYHLFLRHKQLTQSIYYSLVVYLGLITLSEMRFIFNNFEPSLFNFLGELFHTASCVYIGRVVIKIGIENPYEFINELKECAIHDPLTGLFNRKGLLEFTKREIVRFRRDGLTMGVLLMDVDRFKSVNDRHGHMIGDQVLKKFADILLNLVRESDLVCRLGGDEFVLIMKGNMKDLYMVRMRIIESVERWRATDKIARRIGVSIGCAVWDPANPDQADIDLDHLLDIADQEMYREKTRKKALGVNDTESQLQIFNL